eukprot:GHVU01023118.1.p1 GENE.GHVU01023118.1~~GHVU01023118.1.p1  ORF type:complete len:137 (+),score=11.69 GHVU01023118.1:137-547(+)
MFFYRASHYALSEREKGELRSLPLFEKQLFPVDFQALQLRLDSQKTRECKLAMYTEWAKKPSAAPVAPVAPPAQPAASQSVAWKKKKARKQARGGATQHPRGGGRGQGGQGRGAPGNAPQAQRGGFRGSQGGRGRG